MTGRTLANSPTNPEESSTPSPASPHRVQVDGPIPQACEPFKPAHWIATCENCTIIYIGFGQEDTERWAENHKEGDDRILELKDAE